MTNADRPRIQLPSIRDLFPGLLSQSTSVQEQPSMSRQTYPAVCAYASSSPSNHSFMNFNPHARDMVDSCVRPTRDGVHTEQISRVSAAPAQIFNGSQLAAPAVRKPTPPGTKQDAHTALSRNHEGKKYMCHVCQKYFSRPSAVEAHMPSHTGERPYACTHTGCTKSFTTKSNMRRHCQTHTTADTDRISAPPSEYLRHSGFRG